MPVSWTIERARALLGTKFVLIAGLVGFVVLAWLIELVAGLEDPIALSPLLALVVAAVPVVLWLAFFYVHDRLEPEPKHYVAGVSLLGALIAAPLSDFLIAQASPPLALAQHGQALDLDRIVYLVGVVGLTQELCKYAVVRYTVYTSAEFDEPMDGVVYMMSVGAGFALWENYHRLTGQGLRVYLSTGAADAVVTTLAHASFAGALGYVLGRARFTRRSAATRGILVMVGLLGAALLNGQFAVGKAYLDEVLPRTPWAKVAFAATTAALVFAALLLVSRRLVALSPFRPARPPGPDQAAGGAP
jgi:RsiW-degrading membrane proteinase PrsW (M82 family)